MASGVASGGQLTTTVAAPPGSLIVVGISNFSVANTSFSGTLTDTAGNTYILGKTSVATSGVFAVGLYYCSNSTNNLPIGGKITLPTLAGSTWNACAVSVSGANGGIDKALTQLNSGSVTTFSFASGALANANEILFGVDNFNAVLSTYTEGTGFTSINGVANVKTVGTDFAYQIVTSATGVSWAPTFTSSNYAAVLCSFQITPPSGVQARVQAGDTDLSPLGRGPPPDQRTWVIQGKHGAAADVIQTGDTELPPLGRGLSPDYRTWLIPGQQGIPQARVQAGQTDLPPRGRGPPIDIFTWIQQGQHGPSQAAVQAGQTDLSPKGRGPSPDQQTWLIQGQHGAVADVVQTGDTELPPRGRGPAPDQQTWIIPGQHTAVYSGPPATVQAGDTDLPPRGRGPAPSTWTIDGQHTAAPQVTTALVVSELPPLGKGLPPDYRTLILAGRQNLDGQAHNSLNPSTSITATLSTTQFNDVIIVIVEANGGPVVNVTSPNLNFHFRGSGGTSPQVEEEWWAVAASPLVNEVITVTQTSNQFITIDAFGIAGATNPSSPFDGTIVTGNSDPLSISTTNPNTFIFGGFRLNQAASAAGANWGIISGIDWQLTEYKVVTTAQTGLSVTTGAGAGANGGVADAVVLGLAAPTLNPGVFYGDLPPLGRGPSIDYRTWIIPGQHGAPAAIVQAGQTDLPPLGRGPSADYRTWFIQGQHGIPQASVKAGDTDLPPRGRGPSIDIFSWIQPGQHGAPAAAVQAGDMELPPRGRGPGPDARTWIIVGQHSLPPTSPPAAVQASDTDLPPRGRGPAPDARTWIMSGLHGAAAIAVKAGDTDLPPTGRGPAPDLRTWIITGLHGLARGTPQAGDMELPPRGRGPPPDYRSWIISGGHGAPQARVRAGDTDLPPRGKRARTPDELTWLYQGYPPVQPPPGPEGPFWTPVPGCPVAPWVDTVPVATGWVAVGSAIEPWYPTVPAPQVVWTEALSPDIGWEPPQPE